MSDTGLCHVEVCEDMAECDLPTLKAGEAGTVERITADNGNARRLAEIGFVRGARIEMIRPGAPCIVRINQSCVGLGRGHQTSIMLSPV